MTGAMNLTDRRELVRQIIRAHDVGRINEVGGYETDWTIENGKVYWADLDPRKEYRATTLVVMPLDQFIAEYQGVLYV